MIINVTPMKNKYSGVRVWITSHFCNVRFCSNITAQLLYRYRDTLRYVSRYCISYIFLFGVVFVIGEFLSTRKGTIMFYVYARVL